MAATMFGVSDFMSKIGGKGMYAKRNKFTVEITKPVTMNPGGGPMGIEGGVHPSTIEFLVKVYRFLAEVSEQLLTEVVENLL